jgi:Flavodoxin domain
VLSTVTCRFDVDRDVQAGANALGNHAEVLEQLKAPRHATGLCLLHVGVDADLDRAHAEPASVGSAVYVGRWLEGARRFAEEHAEELAAKPTWLFSSGPVGDPPKPEVGQAVQIEPLMATTKARGHRLFAGKIDKSKLVPGERALVLGLRVAEGDFATGRKSPTGRR